MIVNPPRSEVDLSPRLRAISTHAADKNDDPDDRPPLIPLWVYRRLALLGLILFVGTATRAGLWYFTEHPQLLTSHAVTAETYRQLARDTEAEARALRIIVKGGKPSFNTRVSYVTDPVQANVMASQADQLAIAYRRQAYVEECLNLGVPIR